MSLSLQEGHCCLFELLPQGKEFVPYGGLSARTRIHRCGLDGCGGAQEGWGALGGLAALVGLVHTIVLNAVKKGIIF